ncbi:MAG: multidrug resistance efflux transporter family protein [Tissierellia bacterium]|nr:multidrug resistance efflux transporter family protein [Tissierellia bacterium]
MEVIIGVISAFFFAFTFVLNELMATTGGHWMWSASLRFLFMIPMMIPLMIFTKGSFSNTFQVIKKDFWYWFVYSQIGFGAFYIPLCFASSFAPGWLVASTWQLSIVCGTLLIPFIREDENQKIDPRDFIYFAIILLGIFLIESVSAKETGLKTVVLGVGSILISCFAYPLGNRKIMLLNARKGHLNSVERTFAMTLLSLPTWIILSVIATFIYGLPKPPQILSGFIVALSSGIIATTLFFKATQMVSNNMRKLASVEATTSFEIIFSLLLGMVLLGNELPSKLEMIGMAMVTLGVILKSIAGGRSEKPLKSKTIIKS